LPKFGTVEKVGARDLVVAIALVAMAVVALAPRGSGSAHGIVADPRRTPGVLNPDVTQANIRSTICRHGWTSTIRPPESYTNALKQRQMRAYRETGSMSAYQEDHFISLELGGSPTDPHCRPALDRIFAVAAERDLVVHVHTSPGGASDIDQVGTLVDRYGDATKIHLVHLGGGMSGHLKLIGGRLFDWIAAGKKVYTDTSWTIGFAPRWLAQEVAARGLGEDRILFASDTPWGDVAGEKARLAAAVDDPQLAAKFFHDNFETLYAGHSG